jgi:hypothetical protein
VNCCHTIAFLVSPISRNLRVPRTAWEISLFLNHNDTRLEHRHGGNFSASFEVNERVENINYHFVRLDNLRWLWIGKVPD